MTAVPADPVAKPSAVSLWRPPLLALLVANVINALIFVIGKAAGASFIVPGQDGAPPVELNVLSGVLPGVVLMFIGTVIAVLTIPRWPVSRLVLQILGAVLAGGTAIFPFFANLDTGTAVSLALMHVVLAVFWVIGLAYCGRES